MVVKINSSEKSHWFLFISKYILVIYFQLYYMLLKS